MSGGDASGSLGDVVRFVQRTLRKRPTPTMTLLGAQCSEIQCRLPLCCSKFSCQPERPSSLRCVFNLAGIAWQHEDIR